MPSARCRKPVGWFTEQVCSGREVRDLGQHVSKATKLDSAKGSNAANARVVGACCCRIRATNGHSESRVGTRSSRMVSRRRRTRSFFSITSRRFEWRIPQIAKGRQAERGCAPFLLTVLPDARGLASILTRSTRESSDRGTAPLTWTPRKKALQKDVQPRPHRRLLVTSVQRMMLHDIRQRDSVRHGFCGRMWRASSARDRNDFFRTPASRARAIRRRPTGVCWRKNVRPI